MTVKNYKPMLEELYKEIVKIQDEKECELFFEDLCTVKELESMSQRLKAAKMLLENKTYSEIIEETEISSATLSRVSKCIRYGEGGYKNVIEKADK